MNIQCYFVTENTKLILENVFVFKTRLSGYFFQMNLFQNLESNPPVLEVNILLSKYSTVKYLNLFRVETSLSSFSSFQDSLRAELIIRR